ncbi:MAG: fumarylacetoacetate hydrolase family protein [Myxococcota bacterium]
MKLATLPNGTKDGALHVVSRDLKMAVRATDIARTLLDALDRWEQVESPLRALADKLESGQAPGAVPFNEKDALSPLPRAYAFVDGSAYVNHVELVRKARGADLPSSLYTDPLVYQGCSDPFLPPSAPIRHQSEEQGIDFESEVCVILGEVPQGTKKENAARYVRLLCLCNDVTLRNLVPRELEKGFGFFVSKPPSSLSPVAVTPDELGESWRDGRVHLPLITSLNGTKFGDPEAGPEMHFSFHDLIQHVAQTRPLATGTVLGSGTVSNKDRSRGSSCLAEKRMLEKLDTGEIKTPFLRFGDRVRIEMLKDGRSIFGAIDQVVEKLAG